MFTLTIEQLAHDYPGSVVMLSPEIKDNLVKAMPKWESLPLVWEFANTQSKLALGQIGRIKAAITKHQLDGALINMWSPYANTLAIIACKQANIPFATIFHYFQPKAGVTGLAAPIKLQAYAWVGRTAPFIATVSNAHKKVLSQEFGFDAKKIHVLHNGLAAPTLASKKSFQGTRKFLSVGTIEENKGQAYILPILKDIEGDWTLSIVGDGPDRAAIEAQAQALGLTEKVHFLGRQNDMDAIYKDHHVLVHPSFAENLSMAIIEAMAYGLPVIAHNVGGNNELIQDKESGWLVPYKKDTAWHSAIT